MKTFIMVVVVIIMLIVVIPNKWFGKYAQAEPSNSHTALIEEIKKEPKVIEVLVTDANVLYVSVRDDGTNRNGYAEYLCGIAKENHGNISTVKVVKSGSTKAKNRDNAYGILLGESNCQ